MTRRVMPREAMEAERMGDNDLRLIVRPGVLGTFYISDETFASAFVDAELFDAVLTAARDIAEHAGPERYVKAHLMRRLEAALRAYDEGQAR